MCNYDPFGNSSCKREGCAKLKFIIERIYISSPIIMACFTHLNYFYVSSNTSHIKYIAINSKYMKQYFIDSFIYWFCPG
jgi:hypothetical protein